MKLINSYLGNWGRYQAYVYALQFVPAFFMTAMALQLSFTVMTPGHRCLLKTEIKSQQTDSINSSFSSSELGEKSLFYPPRMENILDESHCKYCPENVANDAATLEKMTSSNVTCTIDKSIDCDRGFVWERTFLKKSLGMEWEMVCHDGSWKADFSKSLTMIGFFIGAGLFGMLGDRFGRRPVFLITSYLQIITTNVVPVLPNFPVFCVFQIMNGALSHGSFIICFNIAMELIGGYWAVACGIGIQVISAFGTLYAGSLAFFLDDWRYLHWGVSGLTVLTLLHYWLLDESIRWQIVQGRTDQAFKSMTKALKMNRIEVDEASLRSDIDSASAKIAEQQKTELSAVHLFRDRVVARNTLIVFLTWAACSGSYYGLSFNTEDIPGDMRVNFLISTAMEIPGCLAVIPMLHRLGRKATMVLSLGLAGGAILMNVVLTLESNKQLHRLGRKATMVLSLGLAGGAILMNVVLTLASVASPIPYILFASLGRLGASGAFAAVYVFSAELFPTCLRNSGVGWSSMCARVGSSLAPQIHYLAFYTATWVPSLIYGAFCLAAAALNLLLPETRGLPLPETLQDGLVLHRGPALKIVPGALPGFNCKLNINGQAEANEATDEKTV